MNAHEVYAFSSTIVGALRALGVRDVVLSPGSRSTPLALAFAKLVPAEHLHVVVDERAAGFFALGLARVTGAPTVVCCTSGSAVAHYHAAVLEADLAELPLIVLSADRPIELVRSGASQTIDQAELFGGAVRAFIELGAPDEREPRTLVATIVRAVSAATRGPAGPVHLNARFRKPLEPPVGFFEAPAPSVEVPPLSTARPSLDADARGALATLAREPLTIVVGAMPYGEPRRAQAAALSAAAGRAAEAGHLVLAEPASGVVHPAVFDVSFAMGVPEVRSSAPGPVVVLGQPSIEPRVEAWLGAMAGAPRVLVAPHAILDPEGRASAVVRARPEEVLAALPAPGARHPALSVLAVARTRRIDEAPAALAGREGLGEPGVALAVTRALARCAAGTLLLGNSLAIRDTGRFASTTLAPTTCVHHQRGHAGIDGFLAASAGLRAATPAGEPVVALVGDVTFAHDVGSLSLLARAAGSLVVVVLDNGGGRIFERLPIARADVPGAVFERLYLTAPGLDATAIARAFGVRAEAVASQRALESALDGALAASGATVIVARIDAEADASLRALLGGSA